MSKTTIHYSRTIQTVPFEPITMSVTQEFEDSGLSLEDKIKANEVVSEMVQELVNIKLLQQYERITGKGGKK